VGGVEHVERGAGGLLLGVLLRAPRARADRPPADRGDDLERAVVTAYSTASPRCARRSWSVDLKSTGCVSACSISGMNASTTASAVRSYPACR